MTEREQELEVLCKCMMKRIIFGETFDGVFSFEIIACDIMGVPITVLFDESCDHYSSKARYLCIWYARKKSNWQLGEIADRYKQTKTETIRSVMSIEKLIKKRDKKFYEKIMMFRNAMDI